MFEKNKYIYTIENYFYTKHVEHKYLLPLNKRVLQKKKRERTFF